MKDTPDSFMLTGKLQGYIRLEQDNVKSHQAIIGLHMFSEYIMAALARAEYEVINDPEPYYAHVPGLEGVWATGKTFEECRKELIENIEEWIAIRLRHGFSIPPIDGHSIEVSTEPMAVG